MPVRAQLPTQQKIDEDLATIYETRAPELDLPHEHSLIDRLEPLLMQQARHIAGTLKPWPQDPNAKYLGGGENKEHDIRPSCHLVNGLAVLSRSAEEDAFPEDYPAEAARDDAIAILRFLASTHRAGGKHLDDGTQWYDQWQSALWAHRAGQGAWLLWDELDPQLQWLLARMICDEADRFIGQVPPTQVERDTKSEENAWNAQVIALAYNMFPQHPHNAAWGEEAIRWSITSFGTSRDLDSEQIYDGRPLREWLTGANLHDDYTLENHNRVHPGYMRTIRTTLYLRLMYEWVGNEVPEALAFNTRQVYEVMKRLEFADGGQFFPNGQDWGLRSIPEMLDMHAMAAVEYDDPQAARLLRNTMETYERMIARMPGTLHLPEEEASAAMPHSLLDWGAMAYLLMKSHGVGPEPIGEAQLWRELSGVHVFHAGQFALLRTPETIASFSWGRQVMGLALPFEKDLLLSPHERSMIGSVRLADDAAEEPVAKEVRLADVPGALALTGVISRAGGAVEQRFGFVALPDGRTIYVDILRPTGDVLPESLDLGTIGVLNDPQWVYHDGQRTLYYDDGTRTFVAADAAGAPPVEFSSRWYNVDDRLGIVCLRTSGRQVYHQQTTGARGRLEQLFHLSHFSADDLQQTGPADGSDGTVLARTAIVFYPGHDSAATSAAADEARLLPDDRPDQDRVVLDDGTEVDFDLRALSVTVRRP